MNVLIVEDDPNLRLLWRTVFGDRGFRVTEADSLLTAADHVARMHFELMLLDLYLGRENGLDLVEMARIRNPECQVVIVCGTAEGRLPKPGGNIHAVLRKPVDVEDLLTICSNALTGRARVSAQATQRP